MNQSTIIESIKGLPCVTDVVVNMQGHILAFGDARPGPHAVRHGGFCLARVSLPPTMLSLNQTDHAHHTTRDMGLPCLAY